MKRDWGVLAYYRTFQIIILSLSGSIVYGSIKILNGQSFILLLAVFVLSYLATRYAFKYLKGPWIGKKLKRLMKLDNAELLKRDGDPKSINKYIYEKLAEESRLSMNEWITSFQRIRQLKIVPSDFEANYMQIMLGNHLGSIKVCHYSQRFSVEVCMHYPQNLAKRLKEYLSKSQIARQEKKEAARLIAKRDAKIKQIQEIATFINLQIPMSVRDTMGDKTFLVW